jgi:hypothetical protein
LPLEARPPAERLVALAADAWTAAALAREALGRDAGPRAPVPTLADARELRGALADKRAGGVITSPPYPNPMSYTRELRPYIYWLLVGQRSAARRAARPATGGGGHAISGGADGETDLQPAMPSPACGEQAGRAVWSASADPRAKLDGRLNVA